MKKHTQVIQLLCNSTAHTKPVLEATFMFLCQLHHNACLVVQIFMGQHQGWKWLSDVIIGYTLQI